MTHTSRVILIALALTGCERAAELDPQIADLKRETLEIERQVSETMCAPFGGVTAYRSGGTTCVNGLAIDWQHLHKPTERNGGIVQRGPAMPPLPNTDLPPPNLWGGLEWKCESRGNGGAVCTPVSPQPRPNVKPNDISL